MATKQSAAADKDVVDVTPSGESKSGADTPQPTDNQRRHLEPVDTGTKRLFQTSPDTKEWLTESEAKSKGFYWLNAKETERSGKG
jgi:hypothetical protein